MQSYKLVTGTEWKISARYFDALSFSEWDSPVLFIAITDNILSDRISSLHGILSEEENKKARKFKLRKDQNRYIITHTLLRLILGKFLEIPPGEIEFVSNPYGKLFLSEKYKKIHFNLSHSSGVSVLAFSVKSEIGVDVEKVDPGFEYHIIAKRYFSNAENRYIHELDGQSCMRFYTLWTRKEAFLKSVGSGIVENLDIEVFRKVNHYSPKKEFTGKHATDFYVKSFLFQNNYMISVASNDPGKIAYSPVDL